MQIPKSQLTAAEYAKEIGFRSLKECAEILGKPPQTLNNWYADSPSLFQAAVIGAKVLLDRKNQSAKT